MGSPFAADVDGPPARRITAGRVFAAVTLLALAAFWIYAFTIAPDDKVDGLDDRSFVEDANEICEARFAQLDALPRAQTASTPEERAAVLDQANAIIATLIDELRAAGADAVGRDRELLDLWFGDWDAYLAARERYAQQLRTDPENAVFTVPDRSGGQITLTMDGFARSNRITECYVPLDV
ncbi:MAG TPA: hypothetical protein VF183_11585 [Acidimicrobiales bacterium]